MFYFLFQINDIDVQQLPLQQQQKTALNLLLNEENDNVVLELKRKSVWNISKNFIDCNDVEVGKKMCYLQIQHNATNYCHDTATATTTNIGTEIIMSLHLPSITSSSSPSSASSTLQGYCMTKSTQTEDIAYYVHEHLRHMQNDTERLIEQEHNLFEQSLAPEIDIEVHVF